VGIFAELLRRDGDWQWMEITLRRDPAPDTEFYYHQQFEIYHEPYLIWEKETWEAILTACDVYRVEVSGNYAGDVILEERGKDARYIADFGLLPEYQGKGVGRAVLREIEKMGRRVTAVTRKETLQFFLKCGFSLKRKMKDYYTYGIDGYFVEYIDHRQKMTSSLSPKMSI
jgi:GNAT superfamily N-acetyltransferase